MEPKILKEEIYYYFESLDGLHRSDLMDEKCMDFYKNKGVFDVLEPTGETIGDNEVMSPNEYEIGKICKCTYQVTMTEEEVR